MTPKILYIEDDNQLAFLTKESLEQKGYEVTHIDNARAALELFMPAAFDLCLVDIILEEDLDGFDIVNEFRKKDIHTPILFLTAKVLEEDRIKGLSIGADDYILKPFNIDELDLRIQVFLRRNKVAQKQEQGITLGKYLFLPDKFLLRLGKKEQKLTKRETEVLAYLVQHTHEIIKREDILRAIWGKNDYFLGRSLDVFITKIRKHLADDPNLEIETIHGIGFLFKTE